MSTPAVARWEHRLLAGSLTVVPLLLLPGLLPQLGRAVALQAFAAAALVSIVAATPPRAHLKALWPLLLLLVPAGLATWFSVVPLRSLLGSPERGGGLLTLTAVAIVIAFVALRSFYSARRVRWWMAGLAVALLAYEFVQLVGLDPLNWSHLWPGRLAGITGNPVFLGGTLAMILPYLLEGALDGAESRRARSILGTLVAASFAGIVFTQSRAPILAAGGGLWLVSLVRLVRNGQHGRAKFTAVLGLFALIFSLAIWSGSVRGPGRLFNVDTEPGAGRAHHYDEAIRAITRAEGRAVALGHGLESTQAVVPTTRHGVGVQTRPGNWGYDRTHNLFFELLVTQGVVGLLGFCCFLAVAVLRALRSRDPFRDAAAGALVAFLFDRLLGVDHPTTDLLFAVSFGFLLAPPIGKTPPCDPIERKTALFAPLAVAVAFVGLTFVFSRSALREHALWWGLGTALTSAGLILGRRPPMIAAVGVSAGLIVVASWSGTLRQHHDLADAGRLIELGAEAQARGLVTPLLARDDLDRLAPGVAFGVARRGSQLVLRAPEKGLIKEVLAAYEATRRGEPGDVLPSLIEGDFLMRLLRAIDRLPPGSVAAAPPQGALLLAAKEAFDRAAPRYGRDAQLFRDRGAILRALGQKDAALKDFLSAVRVDRARDPALFATLLQVFEEVHPRGGVKPSPQTWRSLAGLLASRAPHAPPDRRAQQALLRVLARTIAFLDRELVGKTGETRERRLRVKLKQERGRLREG